MSEHARTVRDEVESLSWLHTIALPDSVTTPGHFDTLRGCARVPLRADLTGHRCLDVGTADGFWAFEMERRGATDVVALDVPSSRHFDWSTASRPAEQLLDESAATWGRPFALAKAALGSTVHRETGSIYELSPARLGHFDVVHVGGILMSLRDPVGALERVATVCAGVVIGCDPISLALTLLRRGACGAFDGVDGPFWWTPNRAAQRRWYEAAGFQVVHTGRPFFMPLGRGHPALPAPRGLSAGLRVHRRLAGHYGVLHSSLIARPVDVSAACASSVGR